MIELRWMGPGDDGRKQVIRFPKKHLDLAVVLYRHLKPIVPNDDIGIYDVRGDAGVGYWAVADDGTVSYEEMDG